MDSSAINLPSPGRRRGRYSYSFKADIVAACSIGDLNRRRGVVRGQGQRGNAATIEAQVPLKEMFGYIGSLRALSSGRAQYSMQLDHYGVVPTGEMAALMP